MNYKRTFLRYFFPMIPKIRFILPHYVGIIELSAKKHCKTINEKCTSTAYIPGGKPPYECMFFDNAGAGFPGGTKYLLFRMKAERVNKDYNEFIPS